MALSCSKNYLHYLEEKYLHLMTKNKHFKYTEKDSMKKFCED